MCHRILGRLQNQPKSQLVIEWFIDNTGTISIGFAILGMLITAAYHQFEIKGDNVLAIFASGFLAYGVPVGVLFVLVAFYPEWADKLGEFPLQLTVFGGVYVWYAVGQIKKLLKKK